MWIPRDGVTLPVSDMRYIRLGWTERERSTVKVKWRQFCEDGDDV